MLRLTSSKQFSNGSVYALETEDGYPIETTETHLPFYTKDAIGRHQNMLTDGQLGDRSERWMVGVSTMSGCPVRCRFCATGQLKRWRKLTADEIVGQVDFVLSRRPERFTSAREHKVNYTRMGEPFLNLEAVRDAIERVESRWPGTHHYVSTIGISGSDFSWIRCSVTLQLSLHSLDEQRRDWLIPMRKKMSIRELGSVRTRSAQKTTLNLTMASESDWNIGRLRECFDPAAFFVKVSPINPNAVSDGHGLDHGPVQGINLR